jgi:hypothetical protein
MRDGRLSFTVSASGERSIDVAELDRVFRLKIPGGDMAPQEAPTGLDMSRNLAEIAELRAQLQTARSKILYLEDQMRDQHETIIFLREDVKEWRRQATDSMQLLTDQRAKENEEPPRRSWTFWRRRSEA